MLSSLVLTLVTVTAGERHRVDGRGSGRLDLRQVPVVGLAGRATAGRGSAASRPARSAAGIAVHVDWFWNQLVPTSSQRLALVGVTPVDDDRLVGQRLDESRCPATS